MRQRQIYTPAAGTCTWKAGLAKPELHWRRGHSAFELAVAWELAAIDNANGIPACVTAALNQDPALRDARVLLAIPEHKVYIEGTGFPSQTDLWALLRANGTLISLAVEGKAGEPFGPSIGAWLDAATSAKSAANRKVRLKGLCSLINYPVPAPKELSYQLFHRTASAVLEAQRFGAKYAVMIVQSFSKPDHLLEFQQFAAHLNATANEDRICTIGLIKNTQVTLLSGWVKCEPATDEQIAKVV